MKVYRIQCNTADEDGISHSFLPGIYISREIAEKFALSEFEKYDGSKWWQKRNTWIEHLICIKGKKDEKGLMPFALELCP